MSNAGNRAAAVNRGGISLITFFGRTKKVIGVRGRSPRFLSGPNGFAFKQGTGAWFDKLTTNGLRCARTLRFRQQAGSYTDKRCATRIHFATLKKKLLYRFIRSKLSSICFGNTLL